MPLLSIHCVQSLARGIMTELGAGYTEAIYRNALWKELVTHDTKTVMEQTVPIIFRGQYLGMCRADLVTSEYVIEIKALRTVLPGVGHQIKKYMKHLSEVEPMSAQRVGLVINFNQHTEAVDFLLFQPSIILRQQQQQQQQPQTTPASTSQPDTEEDDHKYHLHALDAAHDHDEAAQLLSKKD
jgi:GxxExxY protein